MTFYYLRLCRHISQPAHFISRTAGKKKRWMFINWFDYRQRYRAAKVEHKQNTHFGPLSSIRAEESYPARNTATSPKEYFSIASRMLDATRCSTSVDMASIPFPKKRQVFTDGHHYIDKYFFLQ